MNAGARADHDALSYPPTSWHRAGVEEVAKLWRTDPVNGLTTQEAAQRLLQHGANEIAAGRTTRPWRLLLDQFRDLMIVILLVAAVVSGMIGDLIDTLVILVIVALNALIGFIQTYRAERAIAALRALAALQARVLRDGTARQVAAAELVPGDVVLLEAGAAVPADVRLTQVAQLRVEEAALTGESLPVDKQAGALQAHDLALGDRRNMAYKGTVVSAGRAHGIVVATGTRTELGRIAQLLRQEEDVKTPLQKRLARFGKALSLAVLAICALLFLAGLLRGEPVMLMALTAISLAVAAIPEALPAVVTMSLALGARRMVANHVLIRKLPAVETLGSVTYICSDKTGTLTLNRMRVECMWTADRGDCAAHDAAAARHESMRRLQLAMAVSNDAVAGAHGKMAGDPTEVALYLAARDAGCAKERQDLPRVAEIAFDASRARMSTAHREGDHVVVFVKGAPESVLPLCRDRICDSGTAALQADAVRAKVDAMGARGLRVLAFATRTLPALSSAEPGVLESSLTFLGLVGMLDPPREEAAAAVALCQSAGIIPVMITGDHPATARNIAQRLGIVHDGGEVLIGSQIESMSEETLAQQVDRVRVYARTSPEHKIRIVKALQARGQYVAMTGDGVNDAPALKRADIGVAMGITGTDAAKEAAHMILLDDNFATIVGAVREGRRIFDNIRKFIRYTMTSNSGEIWTLFLAPFLGLPIPLLPIHILWINLVTDGLPGLALALEREERGIMQRPPRPPDESIFAHGMWQHIVWIGLLMGAVCLISQSVALAAGWPWQTIVFTVLTLAQLGHVLAIRSERETLFALGLLSNLPLLAAIVLTLVLQLAAIYVPMLNAVFKTEPLTPGQLGFCVAMALLVFVAVEVEKWMIRRGWLYARSEGAPA